MHQRAYAKVNGVIASEFVHNLNMLQDPYPVYLDLMHTGAGIELLLVLARLRHSNF